MIKIYPYSKQRRKELELMIKEESNTQLKISMKTMIEIDDLKRAIRQIQELIT